MPNESYPMHYDYVIGRWICIIVLLHFKIVYITQYSVCIYIFLFSFSSPLFAPRKDGFNFDFNYFIRTFFIRHSTAIQFYLQFNLINSAWN